MYKFADLFCGGGGMSLGLIASGMKDTVAVDFWEAAKNNYMTYEPLSHSEFHQMNLFGEETRKELIEILNSKGIDVLAGGPPCQGFSTLGKRDDDDCRNKLVDAYLEIALNVRPKMIIMENVKAIQSMKHGSGMKYPEYAKKLLRDNGYYATTIFMEGEKCGLAQSRKRLFLLAVNKAYVNEINDFGKEIEIRLEKKCSEYETKILRDVIFDLPRLESGEGTDISEYNGKPLYNHTVFKYREDNLRRIENVPYKGGLQDIPDELLSNHLIKMKSGGYGSGGFVKNLYGRLDWDAPSGTIVAGIKKITCGRYFHPECNRLLTVREAARLQAFPDDYIVKGGQIEQYTIIGNAVPPRFSEVIGTVLTDLFETYKKG
ncbi:DNA-cytosine methyltransferase [Clostridioides difficile]|nr:DNA-cytosine methyltransferase [Clostridioides difficile]